MAVLEPSLMIGFSSFLQVTRIIMHKNLDEFDVRSDPTTDNGVSCPLKASEKGMYNVLATLAPSVLIESSSFFLQVTRKTIKSRMHLEFGQI